MAGAAYLHVQLLPLPVDARHEGQVCAALQQQLLPLLACQVQHLQHVGHGRALLARPFRQAWQASGDRGWDVHKTDRCLAVGLVSC